MAGRGRGRGRSVSFNIEALGFGRGEALPGPILQPPPLFPISEFKPVPLLQGDEHDYILALKQEFRGVMKRSPFYIKETEKQRDIERYSDKYQTVSEQDDAWTPDWNRLPAELKPKTKRKTTSSVKPKIPKKAKINEDDLLKTFSSLEEKETVGETKENSEDEKEEKNDTENEEEGEEVDEEEFEDETDYLQSYFDNGEGYGDDEDDADEGPVY